MVFDFEDVSWVVFFGIFFGGVLLVMCLVIKIEEFLGVEVLWGLLDIMFYCDDFNSKLYCVL